MNYQTILLKQNQTLFHTTDLGLLWDIQNKNSLYTTIKRYVQKGVLNRIHKGFYSTKPVSDIDPIKLGLAYLHDYAYVSAEFVLSRQGVINQYSSKITIISNKSLNFSIGKNDYIVRSMKPAYLFNEAGIVKSDKGYKIATPERAFVDMQYYNPHFHFDNKNRVDMKKVEFIKNCLEPK